MNISKTLRWFGLVGSMAWGLEESRFSGPEVTPSPAVIACAASGEVFVGVELQGSLGREAGKGRIMRLTDHNADGIADAHTVFAEIDNPRGISILGNQVFVLHTVSKNGVYDNQQLSVFTDANWDGVADAPAKVLVSNIGNSKFLQDRGADHCTNNIRYAIDGFLYISVGDFGCVDATGTDGSQITMYGGVARVKPDGSQLEVYVTGTRNVYDVAIDPLMNMVTRENTNDGIGWWARASHYIQGADYGYPNLYTNFPEDMLPAMGEYGAGSGVGTLYLEEPQWPLELNRQMFLADWGHSKIYVHELEPNGASFTNKVRDFLTVPQVADLDVDGSGRMYVAAWDGAGYKGSEEKGYISRFVPEGWSYHPFPKTHLVSPSVLIELLKTDSATTRTSASYQWIVRNLPPSQLVELITDKTQRLESRVAALYTYCQLGHRGQTVDPSAVKSWLKDASICEHVIRAATNEKTSTTMLNTADLLPFLKDQDERVQLAAVIALGRIGDVSVAEELLPLAAYSSKDGKQESSALFRSKPLDQVKKSVAIDVNIASWSQLVLVVDKHGVDTLDHAAWINPVVTLKDGSTVDLLSKTPTRAISAKGEVGLNLDCLGNPITFRGNQQKGFGVHAQSELVFDLPKDAVTFTATGVLTKGAKGKGPRRGRVVFMVQELANELIDEGYTTPSEFNPHSTPNKEIILPHLAQKTLVKLNAVEAVSKAIKTGNEAHLNGALATAKFMHHEAIIVAIQERFSSAEKTLKGQLLEVIARLHQEEKANDGKVWWKTRPDASGPYFYPQSWDGTETIDEFLSTIANEFSSDSFAEVLKKNKAYHPKLNPRPSDDDGVKVAKIGNTAIEDIVLHFDKYKGKPSNGKQVITKVGCIGCHNIDRTSVVKGPDLTKLGDKTNTYLAEAIIKPGATIADSWVSLTLKSGGSLMGTIVKEGKDSLIIHNIAGIPTEVNIDDIAKREPGLNMMSLHLCDSLTLNEFADLVAYIQSMGK